MLKKKRKRCDYENCEYSSAYASSLLFHKMTHTGEKLYKCDHENCKYSCADASSLKKHKRTHQEKPKNCKKYLHRLVGQNCIIQQKNKSF